ncbi:NYN domain-containing protein [Nocardia sp. BSTN01]|uniref:NYN domain-containing protein n=1 Tax=Nocardia sp. BSTN01 TaxID=2783665 RepID=UPI0018906CEE|nr:NYN domain-containing protein [Nocardia sp. BSTN01]MBF4996672.1 NYN domain-containing protein [Nocardia sp. BSTN01]
MKRDGRTGDTGAVAVFLDFENLVLGAGTSSVNTNPIPASALQWLCRGFGNASVRRAYADWRDHRFGQYERPLAENGIDLVQLGRFSPGTHKNAADIRLAVDAMETLIAHADIGVFVLVTGDSDFTPLVQKLREYGKHVIGIGTNEASTSARLASVCSEYKFWETVLRQAAPSVSAASQAKPQNSTGSVGQAKQLLVEAVSQITTDTPTASAIKSKMLALDPTFDENRYGYTNFRDFLAKVGGAKIVGRSGGDITVSVPSE